MNISALETQDHNLTSLSYDGNLKNKLLVIANTIRGLTIDAVKRAGSGHAGTPMGCAEIGAYLYGYFLKHNPNNPQWTNRDRFILSAGHASMLQYSCLHMSGFPLSLDDLKNFRQINSKTPSHPQYGLTQGVETTTGLDGQGVAHAVGQALGIKLLASRFNREGFEIYNAKVFVLAGDGCFMEGVSHEASSFAGHLVLNNLVVIYDHNQTCLDGFVAESCSEDTKKRYESYGWDVYQINGHDLDAIHQVFLKLANQNKPVLIIADTIIGQGAPHIAGSYLVHNDPLAASEYKATKENLKLSSQEFYIPIEIYDFFENKRKVENIKEDQWKQMLSKWAKTYPDLYIEFQKMENKWLPEDLEKQINELRIPNTVSGRKASHDVLSLLSNIIPSLYGGSADLARSDMTHMDQHAIVAPGQFLGRNIKYGVREFGMACLAIGLAQMNMIIPFIGTFLAFSDYMLSGIRMAAMMKLPVIYILTHDSIFIGQDGPTHQPIEQLAHLRSIPNMQVIRPADVYEVKMAWLAALRYKGPTAIILSRQDLFPCLGTNKSYEEGVSKGAYIIKTSFHPDFTLIATGSEVSLALAVASSLESKGFYVRVLSMPSWQLFDKQSDEYKSSILGENSGLRISIEAASEIGWHKYVLNGMTISLHNFGQSALAKDLAKVFGFTAENITKKILSFKSQGS